MEQIAGIGLRRLQELLPGLGDTGVDAVLDGVAGAGRPDEFADTSQVGSGEILSTEGIGEKLVVAGGCAFKGLGV